jgi:methylmalonyl-CoA mutase
MMLKEQWMAAARTELNGKEPTQLIKSWENFEIQPYYDKSDVASFNTSVLKKIEFPYQSPNGWLNIPQVDGFNEASANDLALNHLRSGADGITFKISGTANPAKLLNEVEPEFCFLGFETEDSSLSFFEELNPLLIPPGKVNGAIFWKDEPDWLKVANLHKTLAHFRCFGIVLPPGDSTTQISGASQLVLKIVDVLTDYGFSPQQLFQKMAFSLSATENFFGDVAKIRSLKILFGRLCQAYGITRLPAFVRVVSNPINQNYEPHGTLLTNSFGALSAIMASADALTISTDNQNSAIHLNTARSISLLLKEESRLDKVIDPLAGSYFVESLTNSIVEQIWTNLTEKR